MLVGMNVIALWHQVRVQFGAAEVLKYLQAIHIHEWQLLHSRTQ